MKQYLDLLQTIKGEGTIKPAAREGMPGTISLFGHQFRHNLAEGFPLLTTKGMYWKGVVAELLWFLRGDTNVKFLIDHGVNIWNEDAYAYYCKKHKEFGEVMDPMSLAAFVDTLKKHSPEVFENWFSASFKYALGDCGYQYGKVWRDWDNIDFYMEGPDLTPIDISIDQIKNVLNSLRESPQSRRHVVTAWDPAHDKDLALTWCHAMFQFNCRPIPRHIRAEIYRHEQGISHPHTVTPKELLTTPEYYLDCQLYQRSADVFLGVPFNMASYALLTEIMAKMCNMVPGEFIHTFGDVHIYENHLDQVKAQVRRNPKTLPRLAMSDRIGPDKNVNIFDDLTLEDFELFGYDPHPKIKAELSTGIKK